MATENIPPQPRSRPSAAGQWIWIESTEAKQHERHPARCISPPSIGGGLARRVADLLFPWNVHVYPGKRAMLAAVTGAKPSTVKHWLRGPDPLPLHAALRLEAHLRAHKAQTTALLDELRDYAKGRDPVVKKLRG